MFSKYHCNCLKQSIFLYVYSLYQEDLFSLSICLIQSLTQYTLIYSIQNSIDGRLPKKVSQTVRYSECHQTLTSIHVLFPLHNWTEFFLINAQEWFKTPEKIQNFTNWTSFIILWISLVLKLPILLSHNGDSGSFFFQGRIW